ncbi:MAG: hypothetical protein EPO39_04350 [Candidatus Manganitrophaceae bacterium]|nr:MAG: hypothetical protein EPO39_04350 [Candidatus Manganitrophaceae bacterium]
MERRRMSGRERGRGNHFRTVAFFFLLFSLSAPTPASAEEAPKKLELSAAYRYGLPFGEEEAGIDWSDLYDNGSGGAFEAAYRATPRLALYGGVSFDKYKGKEIALHPPTGVVTGRFTDQTLLSLYLGVKGYLLNVAVPQRAAGINPYLRADIGLTQFNGADFNGAHVAERSRKFAFSVGIGADILTDTRFLFFFEARYEDHGAPDQSGGAFRGVPISLGLRYLI